MSPKRLQFHRNWCRMLLDSLAHTYSLTNQRNILEFLGQTCLGMHICNLSCPISRLLRSIPRGWCTASYSDQWLGCRSLRSRHWNLLKLFQQYRRCMSLVLLRKLELDERRMSTHQTDSRSTFVTRYQAIGLGKFPTEYLQGESCSN